MASRVGEFRPGQPGGPQLTDAPPQAPKTGCWRRFKKFLRLCYKLLSSHIGLIVILVAFNFAGAAIFHFIEGGHEEEEKEAIKDMRELVIDNIWNTSTQVKTTETAFKRMLRIQLHKYENQLHEAYAAGVNTDSEADVWDFWGAFFFCATVYTTIGYGNFAPVTTAGRVTAMIYATIGIPLCLIVLADLGKLFTRAIKYPWSFIRRFYYTGRCRKVVRISAEGKGIQEGDSGEVDPNATEVVEEVEEVPAYVVDDEFNLPPIIAIIIAMVYILIGAAIYRQWEKWTYLEAFYFIFISVSTVGFGDVLPDHPKYFLASSLYVLVGLALIAMVINVIMESLESKIVQAKTTIEDVSKTIGLSLEDIEEEEGTSESGETSKTK